MKGDTVPKISRAEVMNGLRSLFNGPTKYLEIGVSRGITFHAVQCDHKVAVDPKFRFDLSEAQSSNPNSVYHQVTSDEYFGNIIDPHDRFDIIYLDGLHTAEQTLRDFANAILFLSPGGVIVVDDVVPRSYVSSLPDLALVKELRRARKGEDKGWMGDVYRLVFFIETFYQQVSYSTISDNHGQLVAWRGRRKTLPERKIEEVGRLPYERVVTENESFRYMPFARILEEVRAANAAIAT